MFDRIVEAAADKTGVMDQLTGFKLVKAADVVRTGNIASLNEFGKGSSGTLVCKDLQRVAELDKDLSVRISS